MFFNSYFIHLIHIELFEAFLIIGNKHIQSIQVYIIFREVLVHNEISKIKIIDRRTVKIENYWPLH